MVKSFLNSVVELEEPLEVDPFIATSAVIGDSDTIDSSAVLQLNSTTQGFNIPSMTTTQRNAISSPSGGLMIYNTTNKSHETYSDIDSNWFVKSWMIFRLPSLTSFPTELSWGSTTTSLDGEMAPFGTRFLIPKSGLYHVTANFSFRTNGAEESLVTVRFRNDTSILVYQQGHIPYLDSATTFASVSFSTVIHLTASITYNFFMDSDTGNTAILDGGACVASVRRIA